MLLKSDDSVFILFYPAHRRRKFAKIRCCNASVKKAAANGAFGDRDGAVCSGAPSEQGLARPYPPAKCPSLLLYSRMPWVMPSARRSR